MQEIASVLSNFRYDLKLSNFDGVWQNPDLIQDFSRKMSAFLEEIERHIPFDLIALTSKVEPSVGMVPIGGAISQLLKKPLVIWKETSYLLTTQPHIQGGTCGENRVAILDTITLDGDTRNIIETFFRQGYKPVIFISINNREHNKDKEIKEVVEALGINVMFYSIFKR